MCIKLYLVSIGKYICTLLLDNLEAFQTEKRVSTSQNWNTYLHVNQMTSVTGMTEVTKAKTKITLFPGVSNSKPCSAPLCWHK